MIFKPPDAGNILKPPTFLIDIHRRCAYTLLNCGNKEKCYGKNTPPPMGPDY